MSIREILSASLARPVTEQDVAGHIADRISAVERNWQIALRDSDIELMDDLTQEMKDLRQSAKDNGLDKERYPGLYR